MATSYDALRHALSTPTLKGFIEVFPYPEARVLVSVAAILGIRDRGDGKGCIITLSSAVMVNGLQNILHLDQPYAEVLALLVQAQ